MNCPYTLLVMMMVIHGILSNSIVQQPQPTVRNGLFTAIGSKYFRPNSNYTIIVSAAPATNGVGVGPPPLKFILSGATDGQKFLSSDTTMLEPGDAATVIIPVTNITKPEQEWTLVGFTETAGGAEVALTPGNIELQPKMEDIGTPKPVHTIFIQTDKPVYKPLDTMQIRVLVLDQGQFPVVAGAGVDGGPQFVVTISDNKKNVIRRWQKDTTALKNGILPLTIHLSAEPNLGTWNILVESSNGKRAEVDVIVKEYVLPKFKVEVKLDPRIVTQSEKTVIAEIRATYTYGKPVKGMFSLNVTSSNKDDQSWVKLSALSEEGPNFVSIPVKPDRVYTLVANVTEINTRRWDIGSQTVRVDATEHLQIDWINPPHQRKLGVPLVVQLQITKNFREPVQDDSPSALVLTPDDQSQIAAVKSEIPPGGLVTFQLSPHGDRPFSQFTVTYKNYQKTFTLPPPMTSKSEIFLQVRPTDPEQEFIQGQEYNFIIETSKSVEGQALTYILLDGGDIVTSQQVVPTGSTGTKITFPVFLPSRDTAEFLLVVYLVNTTNGVIVLGSTPVVTRNYLNIQLGKCGPLPAVVPTTTTEYPTPSPDIESHASTTEAIEFNETVPTQSVSNEVSINHEFDDYQYTGNRSRLIGPAQRIVSTTEDTNGIDYYDEVSFAPSMARSLLFYADETAAAMTSPRRPSRNIAILPGNQEMTVKPNDSICIVLKTYPGSTVALRGVDMSILLLSSTDNDVTKEGLGARPFNAHKDEELNGLGLVVLTNRDMGGSVRRLLEEYEQKNGSDIKPTEVVAVIDRFETTTGNSSTNTGIDEPVRIRKEFPETWIWDQFETSRNNETTILDKIVPDTMTSWIITGFSLNPHQGIGINSLGHRRPLRVFQPFFITLNLPYSVYMGEQFAVEVIVHNYLSEDVWANVTLTNNHGHYVMLDSRELTVTRVTHPVAVKANSVNVAHFAIMPMKLGKISMDFGAVTTLAGDAISQPLRVKPPGIKYVKNRVVMIDLKPEVGTNSSTKITNLTSEFPDPRKVRRVAGADGLKLTLIGDHMWMMIKNLDKLLQLPYGCGEQNMHRFVPNVLTLEYLTALRTLTRETEAGAKILLGACYQQQLTNKKDDGSFAVFAKYHKGSTWLTAYVMRFFSAAQRYISIDRSVMVKGIQFLLKNQRDNGEFVESGVVYDTAMRSRSAEPGLALTAFTTLSLIKVKHNALWVNVTEAIHKGLQFISTQSSFNLIDSYLTNLITCTLVAGGHDQANKFFTKMESAAITVGDDYKYWQPSETGSGSKVKPRSVEMTGYALLAHLWRSEERNTSNYVPMVRWLLSQRNPNGGFVSTQDTVVGLTALTEFAIKTKAKDDDQFTVGIRTDREKYMLAVDKDNVMVLQEVDLHPQTKWIEIWTHGRGHGLLQLTTSWNDQHIGRTKKMEHPDFSVVAKMTVPEPELENEYQLEICVGWAFRDDSSRDIMGEVNLPSGFHFNQEEIDMFGNLTACERNELAEGNTKIVLYFRFVSPVHLTCVILPVNKWRNIAGLVKPAIRVYDYADESIAAVIRYTAPNRVTICDICSQTNACDQVDCDPIQ